MLSAVLCFYVSWRDSEPFVLQSRFREKEDESERNDKFLWEMTMNWGASFGNVVGFSPLSASQPSISLFFTIFKVFYLLFTSSKITSRRENFDDEIIFMF